MAGGHGEHTSHMPEPKMPTEGSKWGYVNRMNRVPYYQALFQRHDGLRQWQKTPRSGVMVGGFKVLLYSTFAGTMWMMGRTVLGHKTWWGPG